VGELRRGISLLLFMSPLLIDAEILSVALRIQQLGNQLLRAHTEPLEMMALADTIFAKFQTSLVALAARQQIMFVSCSV
jgi:hypothetical protein